MSGQLDIFERAALGRVQTATSLNKFGYNGAITTASDPEDIWDGGGLYTGQPVHTASAETATVVSSDAADDAAGTGARTIRIVGLDENWDPQSEDLTMDGTTNVTGTALWHRIFRAYVLTAGSGGANAGTITVNHTTTTANVFTVMQIGSNQSQVACYTVPRNRTLLIKKIGVQLAIASGAAGDADVSIRVREVGGVYRSVQKWKLATGDRGEFSYPGGLVIPAKADIICRVDEVGQTSSVDAYFEGIILAN